MAKMLKPEVEAVRFRGGIDVIATSGNPVMTVSNFGDGNLGNATALFKGVTYSQSNSDELDSAMQSEYGGNSVYISHPTSGFIKMSDVFWSEAFQSDTNEYAFYNGTYAWFDTVSGGIMLFNKQP